MTQPHPPHSGSPRRAVASKGRLALILGSTTAVTPLGVDMYLPALPALAESFATNATRVQLTLSAFFLGLSIGQVFYGSLADRYGRRPMLLIGMVLFVLASIGCATATSVDALIVWRFLQALGSCSGMVIATAVVRDLYSPAEGAHMISRMMLVMGAAPILAPLLGGFVLSLFGWQAIFWFMVFYGVALSVALATFLPETRPAHTHGPNSVWAALKVYASVISHRRFQGYALSRGLAQGGMFAYIAGSPFVFMTLHGVPAQYFGLLFGLNAIGIIGASQINIRLLKKHSPDRILRGALAGIGIAGLLLSAAAMLPLSSGIPGFVALLVPLFAIMALTGLVQPNATVMAMAPFGDRAGSASALIGTLMFAIAAVVSGTVAFLNDGTALPMAVTIAASGWLAFCAYHLLAKGSAVETGSAAETPDEGNHGVPR
jgi:DHA1 family bicyclomycin/chloramphenicol resistance-like MFS transporter